MSINLPNQILLLQYQYVWVGCTRQGTDTSNLDILADPTPETSLMDIGAIRHQLGELLGIPVDTLTTMALPEHFRATVLTEAKPV